MGEGEAGAGNGSGEPQGARKGARRPSSGRISARARSRANAELGRMFAELLKEPDSHQLGVCAKLGIPWRTHMDWMAARVEPGTDLADYQSAVLAALDEQRRLDLENGQSLLDNCHPAKANAQFNMFKFRHENRFRRFYSDEEASAPKQQVELTGKDGGPVETSNVRYVIQVPQEEPEDDPEG